ncbi:hypothetical protein BD414DRAFT_505092 [Trametes punicea]|nr:hypothetical protein BD414DRAFT_505092 [Trametes punicea]
MSLLAKRKFEELDDSDDEEPMLGRQVLPVANLPDTFNGVPMDGMQYLFTVRRDARLLPHVKRAANPYAVPDVSPPAPLPGPSDARAHRNILPSEEWRETFLRRFKNFRKNSVQPTIHVHVPNYGSKLMPDKKERDLWWAFLAGRPESEWSPPKKPKPPKVPRWQQRAAKKGKALERFADDIHEDAALSYDARESGSVEAGPSNSGIELDADEPTSVDAAHSLPTPSGTPAPPDTSPDVSMVNEATEKVRESPLVYLPREPTPALMQHIDHVRTLPSLARYAMHLLMYFTHWINLRLEQRSLPLTDITQSHARWMFILLSRVDDWISSDETSLLRNLARACISILVERRRRCAAPAKEAQAAETAEEANMINDTACWMIISAVTGMWGQKDLWMDAEALLSKVEADTVT